MKLNLLTTLTSQKMISLFLLGFLQINKNKAGQAFRECLDYNNASLTYDLLTKFNFSSWLDISGNIGSIMSVCCDNLGCSPGISINSNKCYENTTTNCCVANTWNFLCGNIPQTQATFCTLNNFGCGGMIGGNLITSRNTAGYCSGSLNEISNGLINSVPNHGLVVWNSSVAWNCTNCFVPKYLSCYWDDGGWTCEGNGNFVRDAVLCYLQWPAVLLITTSSTIPTTAILTAITTDGSALSSKTTSAIITDSSTFSSVPAPNDELKIIIPAIVGTGVGSASLTGLAFYLINRRKKTNQQQQRQIDANQDWRTEIELPELQNRNNNGYQAFIQVPLKDNN